LISSVERDATNIEQRKEKAIKNFGKFKGRKCQHSQRVREQENLIPCNSRDHKKCISIGPIENKITKPLKMSFTKDREHLLSRQLSICTQSDEVIVNSKSICKDEISSKPEVNEVQSNTPNEEVSSQLTDSKEDDPKRKKIHSENEHANIHQNNDRISFSGRAARSNSKRSSLEMKTANEQKDSFRKPRLNMLSSSNSSRSKSKEKASFALTMNPISTTNFKYAIGNLPIKVSRDDDMLFSFRNQVMTNRSIKESETNQLPESINSRHGKITYLLTSLEDTVSQFLCDMKL
jgi:hypothetical protein